ncbi:hypothetical protein R3P38DRAFT_2889490 [Favolaschia claudopus]|uniref:ATP synthase protein MI25 n=1 Tax=Favolaschia claudopus TaxID=2862362 RepID=A0AAW0CSW4_9AGAR
MISRTSKTQMPDLVVQLLPLALTPLAGLVPNNIQRSFILTLAVLYFTIFVVLPNRPSIRLQKLEKEIDDTLKIHAMAVQELEGDPCFVAEASLRVAQIKLRESVLRAKVLGGGDVAWRRYPQYLRGLSINIGGCQRDAQKVGALMMTVVEFGRQRKYTEDIAQRQTILETVFLKSIREPAVHV